MPAERYGCRTRSVTDRETRRPWLEPVENKIVIVILALTAVFLAMAASGCAFVEEGAGSTAGGEGEGGSDLPPRLPWRPQDAEDSSSSEGAGPSSGGTTEGSGEGIPTDSSGIPTEGSEGSSSSTGEGSSTGEPETPAGPCDESCAAPWGCSSNGTWERCVLACVDDEGCPEGWSCDGVECYLPCPCEGAECFGASCWWPA